MSEIPLDVFAMSMGVGLLLGGVLYLVWRAHDALTKDHPTEVRNGVVYPVRRRRGR